MKIKLPLALSLLAAGSTTAAEPQTKPNIILIYSDDHGWADLGAQGVNGDIRTPSLDKMAADGVRFTHGYTTAPQSAPSRAGVITGRYQQRFGLEDNSCGRALPLEELTIAERLKEAGYVSCQVGKWHLDNPEAQRDARSAGKVYKAPYSSLPKDHGFEEYYNGQMNSYVGTHDLQGNKFAAGEQKVTDARFRCVWQADAGMQFIKRHAKDPFFLYLAFFAPHVPLESPEPWFSKTSANLPLKRRQALAMIAAMDEGIGKIRETLRAEGLEENTLIFFIGDNGAPLRDSWDGSINLPLIGEKGMVTDGGMRTPFLAAWPGTLPAGKVDNRAVSSLDVAATVVEIAGLKNQKNLDGVNLMPYLQGRNSGNIHDALYWRWHSQAAILMPPYKMILLGDNIKYLFDTTTPEGEKETKNCIKQFPEIAQKLEKKLMEWDATLPPPGLPRPDLKTNQKAYDIHVNSNGYISENPEQL
jgi:arylsulfatase A-like enzyme